VSEGVRDDVWLELDLVKKRVLLLYTLLPHWGVMGRDAYDDVSHHGTGTRHPPRRAATVRARRVPQTPKACFPPRGVPAAVARRCALNRQSGVRSSTYVGVPYHLPYTPSSSTGCASRVESVVFRSTDDRG